MEHPTIVERRAVEVLKVLRSRFSEDHILVAAKLIDMATHACEHTKRLPAVAYHKGLIAGLSHDSTDDKYPECPYDARQLPNFAKGDNDPRKAWRHGSHDGLRIQSIINRPQQTIWPPLQSREFKALTPELQQAHDSRATAAR